jgi:hypothetical protein
MIALLGSGFVTLRRIIIQRADVATFDQRELAPGELVYLVNTDGSITLRVGDGIVADGRIPYDPAASRVIVRRVLDPVSEYYVEAYGGAIANADQSYQINADNVSTAGLRVVSIRDPIASVTFDKTPDTPESTAEVTAAPLDDELIAASTNVVTLTASTLTSMYISNIVVTAWSDRSAIGATNDMRETTVFTDNPTTRDNPTTLGHMQDWLAENEGKHWSLWPALNHIQMAGYALISGTNNWIIREENDGLLISAGGHRVATFSPATDTNAAPQIRDVYYDSTAQTFAMWVWSPAPATRAPEVGSVASLSSTPLVFMPYNTVSNSWPSTVALNGTNVYYIVCAAPESSRLFKVFIETATATPPTLDVRSLKIDGTSLTTLLAEKVSTNRTITINGVAGSLSSNVAWTITGEGGSATNASLLTYGTTNLTGNVALDTSDFAYDGTTLSIAPTLLPGPGCTALGTTNAFVINGSTVYYRGVMSGACTVTVSRAYASGYTYSLKIIGTNSLTLANATLLNSWTLGGTNTYVFSPSETNSWEVRGMTP